MNRLPALVFDTPWALALGLLVPLLVFAMLAWRDRQRTSRLAKYGDPGATSRLLGDVNFRNPWRTARLLAATLLLGLALSGPRWGLARGATGGQGIDMAIALDASLSMTATDERPSRLERMKQEVRRLRAMSRADRVALIAFAGRSYILTPLTGDDGAIELFLDNLDPSVVGQAGSSLSRAIRQGTELLMASDGGADRALIVMSDGEAFEPLEDVEAASKEAGQKGVSLVTVGFGTEQGATIPIREGNEAREKRDEEGKVVITRYSPETLQAAATAAGGSFVGADVSDKAARIRGALRSLRTARRVVDAREDHVPRFVWLLAPALLILLFDSLVAERGSRAAKPKPRRDKRAKSAPSKVAAQLVVLAALAGPFTFISCAKPPDPAALLADGNVAGAIEALQQQFAEGDSSASTRYNLGSALLSADSLEPAAELLEGVRRGAEGEVLMRSRFNAGLSELKLGKVPQNPQSAELLAAARAAYRSYLTEKPADLDAKWNYELALQKTPPTSGGGGGANDPKPQPPQPQQPKPSPGALDQKQAEALLNSAAREERDVQGRKQKQGRTPPPGGKDW
ncbi:MAG: VWA domain-containing protein [Phycisphaerae bacterium]|nr:VWA domain-containing protein [Gemmatimonadaceae bacterium]